MYIIVGLGNPGLQYAGTRHNIGFGVIEELADAYNITMNINRNKGICGKGIIEGQKVLLVMPQTFMNNSGECVREILDYYKEEVNNLLVIHDDSSLLSKWNSLSCAQEKSPPPGGDFREAGTKKYTKNP